MLFWLDTISKWKVVLFFFIFILLFKVKSIGFTFLDGWLISTCLCNIRYFPLKFDHSWLKNDDLCLMVKIFLENFENSRNTNVMEHFCFKLKELKKEVVFWTKNKEIENRATLKQT